MIILDAFVQSVTCAGEDWFLEVQFCDLELSRGLGPRLSSVQ